VLEGAEPKEFADLGEAIRARDLEVFFGAYDPQSKPIGFMERLTRMMPATKDLLQGGDFRDWPAIEAWAEGIGRELQPIASGAASA
jgi:menaquinone-dependent protoporphyrinogen oxidase